MGSESKTIKKALQPGETEEYGFSVDNLKDGEYVDEGLTEVIVTVPFSSPTTATAIDLADVQTLEVTRLDADGEVVGQRYTLPVAERYDEALVQLLDEDEQVDITADAFVPGSLTHSPPGTAMNISGKFTAPIEIASLPSDGFVMKIQFTFTTTDGRVRQKEFEVPIASV